MVNARLRDRCGRLVSAHDSVVVRVQPKWRRCAGGAPDRTRERMSLLRRVLPSFGYSSENRNRGPCACVSLSDERWSHPSSDRSTTTTPATSLSVFVWLAKVPTLPCMISST
jgi:hypothetical protein